MKLVTWNTQSCKGLDGQVRPGRIVEDARALADFDVLCLQEIADGYPGLTGASESDQPAAIAALLPGFEVFFGPAVIEFDRDGHRQRFGNLVATRLPVAQVQHHPLPYPADAGVECMPRMCTVITVLDPRHGAVRVMTTHLEFYSPTQRLAQAQALRALHLEHVALAQAPPKVVDDGSPTGPKHHSAEAILCGDFNAHERSTEYAALTALSERGALWDAWRLIHGEARHAPTFCVHEQKYLPRPVAFDFVFVSGGLTQHVRRIEVDGATRASDHQPVVMEV
jgi:endonuclease/exonuclease/phosphatase family metal-dependent hydrolase